MYPSSFDNLIKDSDKDFISALGLAVNERDNRTTRKTKVEVYEYEPSDINALTHLAWSGSIALILAPKNAEILDRVRTIVKSKSADDVRLATELKDEVVDIKPIAYNDAVKVLIEEPVFASLKYKDKVLSSGMFVPDGLSAYTSGIPFNGGSLDDDAFELVEHLQNESTGEELEAIILKRAPVLTDAEKFAVDSLADDELNLGIGIFCYAISAVTVTVGACAVTSACCPHTSDYKRGLRNPEAKIDVSNASPEAIARNLINTRREIIEGILT